jgi:hypothetical protein
MRFSQKGTFREAVYVDAFGKIPLFSEVEFKTGNDIKLVLF